MNSDDDEFKILLARIGNQSRSESFINQVLRAARKAGHDGSMAGRRGGPRYGRSTFGGGRLFGAERRVVVKARVVRHRGLAFTRRRSPPT